MRQNRFGIARAFAIFLSLLAMPAAFAAVKPVVHKFRAYVGTYTTGESKGIYLFDYDSRTGKLEPLGLAAETENPSFVVANRHFLYAVNEGQKFQGQPSGGVSAFSIDETSGKLTFLNEVPSRGADPCYISFDKTGKFVLVANYTGGSVAVFPIHPDGHLGEATGFVQHSGTGPNHDRQEGPHAHWIETTPDNRFAIAADLGTDKLVVYHFDAVKGLLSPNDPPFAKGAPGSGPRHLAFHPDGQHAYLIDEMVGAVNSFAFDSKNGTLHLLQTIPTLPKDFSGENTTAEIAVHPNGGFVYGSNRGHDSIVVYAVDPRKGTLTQVQDVPTQGKTPRHFQIDPTGTRLFVANEDTGNLVGFRLNPKTGRLTPSGDPVKVPNPVCLKFVPAH